MKSHVDPYFFKYIYLCKKLLTSEINHKIKDKIAVIPSVVLPT